MSKIIFSDAAGIGSYVVVLKKIANGAYELQGDQEEVEKKVRLAIENVENIYIGVLDDKNDFAKLENANAETGEEFKITSKSLTIYLDGDVEIEENQPVNELPEITEGDAGKVLTVKSDETGVEYAEVKSELPALPADAATKTYSLQAINGVLTWVEVSK